MQMPNFKFWPYALIATSIVAIYLLGYSKGEKAVTKKWVEAEAVYSASINKTKGEYNELTKRHSEEVSDLTTKLSDSKKSYEDRISFLNDTYATRLQQSESRANIYQRQASSGTIECSNLASHAARLDSSIEQGRRVVEELTATVRFRDQQLIQLGNQIKADRKLLK